MDNNYLKHHGVKGMRWGVIKKSAEASASAAREAANIAGKATGHRAPSRKQRKSMASMSDTELRARINRMSMEQQYADLNPSRISRGAAVAKSFLEVAGSVAAIGGSVAAIMLAIQKGK